MPDQDQVSRAKAEVAELAEKLKERIPAWISGASGEFTTVSYGVAGKCCNYAERLLKNVLLVLRLSSPSADSSDLLSDLEKSTLGDIVRLIKAHQRESDIFQQAEKRAVGQLFSLLDRIVALRNKLIHVKIFEGSEEAKRDLHALLDSVNQLCNSWVLDKVAGLPSPQNPTLGDGPVRTHGPGDITDIGESIQSKRTSGLPSVPG